MTNNIIGVDLALKVIQVCVYTNKKVQSNTEMTPEQFSAYISTLATSTIIFEACSGSNYWSQLANNYGHTTRLISPRLVNVVRQNQKTDKNDALAIIQAALLPDINFVSVKSNKQQQVQSMLKLREQCIKQRTALKNQLMALLREFNLSPGRSLSGLIATIECVLEDGENGFTMPLRKMLKTSLSLYLTLCEAIETYDEVLNDWVNDTPECKKLLKIEGIGKLNAIHLYVGLSTDELGQFKAGKDAAACIGLTPLQHSSGGKVKLGSIGRRKNTSLRSLLITGAMSVVQQIVKRAPKTTKEVWLKALIDRRGKKCAAVALANKNVRTAFALLKGQSEYKAVLV